MHRKKFLDASQKFQNASKKVKTWNDAVRKNEVSAVAAAAVVVTVIRRFFELAARTNIETTDVFLTTDAALAVAVDLRLRPPRGVPGAGAMDIVRARKSSTSPRRRGLQRTNDHNSRRKILFMATYR
uniref:Uncharacterized protein n=1 Tax=Romanomermis culicivorax TaxID=13658 RepID=A0A915IHV7_ROMCU